LTGATPGRRDSSRPTARTDFEKQTYADKSLECASVTVPLDYAKPAGGTVTRRLALAPRDGRRSGQDLDVLRAALGEPKLTYLGSRAR
jgi:hypothetical protein